MESWIDRIVRSTKNLESPESYFWWSSIAAISAVIKKQVFLDRGGAYKLYPNIYVVLVSKHSGLRKGLPVSLAAKWIAGVNNTRLVEGRNSIQSVISEFAKMQSLPNGKTVSDAQGILISGELDNLFVKDPQALSLLTELYNTHEHNGRWKNTLKGSGIEELKNPCISLLGAANEVMFDDFVQKRDVEGGFIARTFIVHESKKRLSNPLTEKDPDLLANEIHISGLIEISKTQGEYQFSPRAKKNYERWYKELGDDIEQDRVNDKTGYIHRLGDSVLKVAMLINLARQKDLIIHSYDLEEAVERCESCLQGVKVVTSTSGTGDELVPLGRRVVELLSKAPEYAMARNKILIKLYPDVNSTKLNAILETLEQAGCVRHFRDKNDNIWHQLLEPAFQLFSEAKKRGL